MAATVLAIRRARPAVSAMSSQSFETSTPMHKGPATAERSVEADRRGAAMGCLSQEGEGPLAQDCNSGWARPTVRAQDRKRQDIEIACELVFHPESISPSCPPFLPQTQCRKRTAGQHVQSRGTKGARRSLDCFVAALLAMAAARSSCGPTVGKSDHERPLLTNCGDSPPAPELSP